MAYKVTESIVLTPTVVNATTYAVAVADYDLTLVDDDYVVLYVHSHAATGSLSISGSGWSELVELDVTSGGQMAVYYCKVASGTVADPTITATVTTTWQVVMEQWRDADTTTFAEVPTPTQANATSVDSPTFTPAAADGAIVYFGAARGSTGQHCRFLSDKVVAAANPQVDVSTSSFAMAIGTVQQAAAAATAQTMYAPESARLGCITFAVKNKTGGKVSRDCRAAMTKVGWFGNYGTAHELLGSLTFNAPSTFCVWNAGTEQMVGIDVATSALTPTHTTVGLPPINGRYTDMPSTTNTAGQWVGVWWATPSTLDMTGKIFTLEWFMATLGDAVGGKGVVIAFGDDAAADTGNAAVFQLAPKLQIPLNTLQTSHIAVDAATPFASVGSINWATVKKLGVFYHRAGSSTNNRSVSWRNMFLHGSSPMTGGNETRPLNGQFLHDALNGWGYTGLCTKSGDAMLAKTSFTFGDGSKPTYMDTTATLINTPAKYSVNSQSLWNVPVNEVTIGVNAASGDTYNFTASAIASGAGAEQNFTVTSASGATVSTQGGVFGNLLWTGTADFDPNGATYSGCDTVAWAGATVTNCSVTNTTSTNASASVTANTTISDTTIDGTGSAYALEFGTSVTAVTLADCTLTAGSTDKIHVLRTTGTVTITISGTTALVSGDVTSDGAAVVISAPELYQVAALTGFTVGSLIQIYDTDYNFTVSGVSVHPSAGDVYSQNGVNYTIISSSGTTTHAYGLTISEASGTLTRVSGSGDASITFSSVADDGTELFNGTASSGDTVISGSTCTWTDSVAAVANRYIRVRIGYVSGATAKAFLEAMIGTCGITSGTESISYLVSQEADTTYNTNAIDGPSVYATSGITFTDATTDLVNCNVAGGAITHPTVYACFVHWVSNTTTGIADDIAYIDAPDTANYIYSRTKFKNTSSPVVPLSVTGGWGRDAVTGLSITLWDSTGGAIGFSGDHAVPYSAGSGLTAGQAAELTAAAASSATAVTDIAAVPAEVLAAATATPIAADLKKVLGTAIQTGSSDTSSIGY